MEMLPPLKLKLPKKLYAKGLASAYEAKKIVDEDFNSPKKGYNSCILTSINTESVNANKLNTKLKT